MTFLRVIPEGGDYPGPWYGRAYDRFVAHREPYEVVCAPIPFNVVVKIAWILYQHLRSLRWLLSANYRAAMFFDRAQAVEKQLREARAHHEEWLSLQNGKIT